MMMTSRASGLVWVINRSFSPRSSIAQTFAWRAASGLQTRRLHACWHRSPQSSRSRGPSLRPSGDALQDCRTVSQVITGYICSHGLVALDRDPVHDAALAVIVVESVVLGATVVPDRQRARFPAEAASELGPHKVALEIVEQRLALRNAHIIESNCVG